MKTIKLLLLFILSICAIPHAYEGYGAGPALNMGAGARAMAMGNAYVAVADDATAGYWNPAGLALVKERMFTVSTLNYGSAEMSDLFGSHTTAGAAYPFGQKGSLSFNWIHQAVDGIEIREKNDFRIDHSQKFSSFSQDAFMVSYGRALVSEQLFIGLTYKIFMEKLLDYTATAPFGLDFGMMYLFAQKWRIGVSVQKDMAITWEDDHVDHVPARARAGIAYHPPSTPLLLAVDVLQMRDAPLRIGFGGEYVLHPRFLKKEGAGFELAALALRAGVDGLYLEEAEWVEEKKNNSDNTGKKGGSFSMNQDFPWCLGLGLDLKAVGLGFAVDYAIGPYSIYTRHRFSFSITF